MDSILHLLWQALEDLRNKCWQYVALAFEKSVDWGGNYVRWFSQ